MEALPQFYLAIFVGVFSGCLTALLIWIIRKIFINIFSPWLEQRLYKGVLLDGTWNATVNFEDTRKDGSIFQSQKDLTLNLHQKGNKVNGNFYARSKKRVKTNDNSEGPWREYANQYTVEGAVNDNYVTLNYQVLSRHRTGQGAFVLKITHGGTKLKGGISFIGEGEWEFVTTIEKIIFERS